MHGTTLGGLWVLGKDETIQRGWARSPSEAASRQRVRGEGPSFTAHLGRYTWLLATMWGGTSMRKRLGKGAAAGMSLGLPASLLSVTTHRVHRECWGNFYSCLGGPGTPSFLSPCHQWQSSSITLSSPPQPPLLFWVPGALS